MPQYCGRCTSSGSLAILAGLRRGAASVWWRAAIYALSFRADRALHLRGYSSVREPEPFASIIRCTSDPDERTRSKWSRVLRFAADSKALDEPLRDFIKRKGVINE